MTDSSARRSSWSVFLGGLVVVSTVALTGCQIDAGGQTLPSPFYQADDVQYFPPGTEFKLSKEATAQKAYSQEQALRR